MSKVIGIDLGTTNCCVSVMEGGAVQIIPNKEGGRTMPSVVGFTDKGERLVGQIAKRQAVTNSSNTLYAVKRLIGRKFDSPEAEKMMEVVPFEIVESPNGDAHIRAVDEVHSPPEISAIVLQRLKQSAEEFLGDTVDEAIITVPAYFDDMQRQATRDAGKIAGLKVERIINEPTAAALAYGFDNNKSEKIVVYDLGGGTFDITILEINDGVFEVLSTSGNTFLGGEDFDQRIIDWLVEDFKQENDIDLRQDRLALQRLKEGAERAKCELSSVSESTINLPFVAADASGPKHVNKVLTREKFEELVSDLVESTVEPCQKALWDAKLQPEDIDKIILVGGQTRSPIVGRTVEEVFGKPPSSEINPDEVVAMGAAIQGGVLAGDVKDIVLLDVLPLSLGLETRGGLFVKLIERNSTIPLRNTMTFTTVVDNQQTVEIHILQGEREIANGNRSLGKFELVGIPPADRGIPQIDVTFEVDASGIVSVSAKDKMTGLEQAMQVTPSSGLAPDEIDALILEAKKSAEADRDARDVIVTKNSVGTLIENTRKSLIEFGKELPKEDQVEIKTVLAEAERDLAEGDLEKMKEAQGRVEQVAAKLSESLMSLA
ncbi:MAG: molecular chaperone DnaK [Acidobacteria bacterium]|nr:MAG: molecular chaperone DnaK [Acidobacteriota bacterium]REK02583.1 MAG: molecular chaperone DnaK [Acidobacteriota bacterium]REK13614.1 MAG: molecular chaperone DnaK [Acidobacteriota bacterium]REK41608.1 MAG: molecular chaperone DnaK [Acidobacteriota bacterium]